MTASSAKSKFLTDAQVTLLADRRTRGPYGLSGGNDAAPGRTIIIRHDGSEEEIPGKTSTRLRAGERVRIESPGGGGWGDPPKPRTPGVLGSILLSRKATLRDLK